MKPTSLLLSLVLVALPAYAATPSVESVEALLVALDEKNQMNELYASLEVMNRQGATLRYGQGQAKLTSDQQRAVDIVVATATTVYKRDLTWESIKPEVVKLMQDAFTQEQVDAAIAFYSSPSGNAFVRTIPLIKQKTGLALQAKLEEIQPRAMQEAGKALRDAKLAK
jgi:uncharacterized protein